MNSSEESRYYLILTQDLGYARTGINMGVPEEAIRLLNAYAQEILAPDFWLPYPAAFWRDIKGASPWLVSMRPMAKGLSRRDALKQFGVVDAGVFLARGIIRGQSPGILVAGKPVDIVVSSMNDGKKKKCRAENAEKTLDELRRCL